jgi:murein DD-endopeptidase MepM/ murein hydrolase activator NlpD
MNNKYFAILSIVAILFAVSTDSVLAFPSFGDAVFPVKKVPHWGGMQIANEWNRKYEEMSDEDFIDIPRYDLTHLTKPLEKILISFTNENRDILTEKLVYSTRYFGAYDLDAGEFSANHPGIDIKLPLGTPVRSIGGGIVDSIREDDRLGLHMIIGHHIDGKVYYSVYGHLNDSIVHAGDVVLSGDVIGTVGMTGSTNNPHLHIQIDRGIGTAKHEPYYPDTMPSRALAEKYSVNPMTFIERF